MAAPRLDVRTKIRFCSAWTRSKHARLFKPIICVQLRSAPRFGIDLTVSDSSFVTSSGDALCALVTASDAIEQP